MTNVQLARPGILVPLFLVADLNTSDGPGLKIWLTDAPVTEGPLAGACSMTVPGSTLVR